MKPKIVVIITRSEIGGAQKYVLSMTQTLAEKFDFRIIVGSEGYLADALRKSGIEVHVIKSLNSLNIINAVYSLRRLLTELNPVLVNTHSTLASVYGRIAADRKSMPVIYSVHGWFFAENAVSLRKWFGPFVERLLKRYTTFWITETRRDQLTGLSKRVIRSEADSEVVPNGIPTPVQRPLELSADSKNIAFVGRISYQKNPKLALQVMSLLPPHYRLTLYCDDAQNPELASWLSKLELHDRVNVVDDEQDTSSIIGSYDLLMVTSRYEGMPLSIIEAMSAGLPVICPDVCGLDELVRDGQNGFLVTSEEAAEYAAKVQKILEDTELHSRMSNRSTELFQSRHKLKEMTGKIDRIFTRYSALAAND